MAEHNTRNAATKSKAPTDVAASSTASKRSKNNLGDAVDRDDTSIVSGENSNDILITSRANDFSNRTWWMVDMHNGDDDDNSTTQGATALVKRCMRVYNWSLEKTRKVLTAYRQFLTLKKEHKDWNATILSPSYVVDQMWHQHILDVVNYTHDMMLLCGRVVGHNPDGGLNLQKKVERDETTHIALEKRFASKYDKEIWGTLEIKKEQDVVIKTEEGEATAAASDATNQGQVGSIENNGYWMVRVLDRETRVETTLSVYSETMGALFNKYAQRNSCLASDLFFAKPWGPRILANSTPRNAGLYRDNELIHVYTNKTIRIKVTDENGHDQYYNIGMTSNMQELFDTYAYRRGLVASELIFTSYHGQRLSSDDTPIDTPSLRDVHHVYVYSSESSYLNGQVIIRLSDHNEKKIDFKIKRNAKLRMVFHAYAARANKTTCQLRFFLDGDRIDPEETPSSLGLEDDDQIDVFMAQCAC